MGVPEALGVLGQSKAEIAAGVATGVVLGLSPDILYGRNPQDLVIVQGDNRYALTGGEGFLGTQINGPQPFVSSMAEVVTTPKQQPFAEGGIALAGACLAAAMIRGIKGARK